MHGRLDQCVDIRFHTGKVVGQSRGLFTAEHPVLAGTAKITVNHKYALTVQRKGKGEVSANGGFPFADLGAGYQDRFQLSVCLRKHDIGS